MKLRFTAQAERRAGLVDRWWRQNRPEAPDLFKPELGEVQQHVLANPHAGTPHLRVRDRLFRRVLLPRTRQWMYYRVVDEQELIVIHAVWGAQRGRDPKLR